MALMESVVMTESWHISQLITNISTSLNQRLYSHGLTAGRQNIHYSHGYYELTVKTLLVATYLTVEHSSII